MRKSWMLALAVTLASFSASGQIVFPDSTTQNTAGVVYTRIVVVNANGNSTQNGTALLAALSGITTNTSLNRFLIHLEPGDYDLAAASLTMKPFVDLQGSGLTNTTLTSSGAVTVNATDNAFLRSVRLQNTGSNSVVLSVNAVSTELFRVSCVHLGASGSNTVVQLQNAATVTLLNGLVSAGTTNGAGSNTGISVSGSTLDLRSMSVSVSGGATNTGMTLTGISMATLGFAQVTVVGGTGVSVGGTATCSVVSSAIVAPTATAVDIASGGIFAAGATAFDGAFTGVGSPIFVQCFTTLFAPIADTLP